MSKKVTYLVLLLFILLNNPSCHKKDNLSKPQITDSSELDQILNHYVEENYYPFIYARLEDLDGNVMYEHSAVNDKLLPGVKIDGDTWIRIWSMSKIITISIVLDLIEDGILNLSDPVAKYIPEFENLQVAVSNNGKHLINHDWEKSERPCPVQFVPNDSIMTILHLINHQAGFYYATTGIPCLDSMVTEQNLPMAQNSNDFIKRMSELPLIQHSGSNYYYGINTTVLGLVAEKATDKTLTQLVQERVTRPLKIKGLDYRLPKNKKLLPKYTGRDSILREANRGELNIFGPDVPDYDSDHQLYLGGEGMVATANGYADFVRMLLQRGNLNGHQFLEKETVEAIYAPHTNKDSPYGHNGYNLWVSGDSMRIKGQGEAGLWIGGGYECTYFWADPKRKFVGIIMSQNNEVRPPGYELNDTFRGALYKQFWEREGN